MAARSLSTPVLGHSNTNKTIDESIQLSLLNKRIRLHTIEKECDRFRYHLVNVTKEKKGHMTIVQSH